MSDTKRYQSYNLEIIVNKKLKHSYIHIKSNKDVIVKTPYASRTFVDTFLEEKSAWIEKQLQKIDKLQVVSKEELYSKEFIKSRVLYFSNLMQLEFTKLKFRKMKSRWGSCNSKKEITLNSELMRVEQHLIDYVVVHELAHIKHMNHSKIFHQLVEDFLPYSKEFRKELKKIKLV